MNLTYTHIQFDINDINFELLKKRGPNSFEIREIHLDNYICYFAASVLSLRGNNVVKQPINDDINRNYLLWNGEIFASSIINVNNDANDNDGIKLYQHLSNTNNEQEILDIIATIKGPFAFIYFDRKKNLIFFGRDRIGRRSLLINSTNNTLMLTSVRVFSNSCDNRSLFEFNELKSNGIYKLNLNNQFENLIEFIEWIPLSCEKQESFNQNLKLIDSISLFNESLNQIQRTQDELEQIREELLLILKQSILRRIKPLPNQCKNCYLLSQTSNNSNNKFSEFKCDHAKIAILFSGGLDSAVIAALVDQCLPENEPVDLMNIAFEQSNNNKSTSHNSFMVPDRISGLECLKELNPKRKWNFIEINITHDELKDLRAKLIKNLIYPLDTVLDDSIGCALWFVSRGIGYLNGSLYQSGAEILLLGIGADEQLAGYARHRTRFRAEGWLGLINELKMEMKRISEVIFLILFSFFLCF